MAKLAIIGHATRGKEVIQILTMLGGSNIFNHECNNALYIYYINESYKNYIICSNNNEFYNKVFAVFTLEEFLDKFPYNIGDKVYNIIQDENQIITNLSWNFQENEVVYQTDNNEWVYVNYIQPYKEETIEKNEENIAKYIEKTIQECIFGKKETMEENNQKSANHVFDTEVITFDIAQRDKYELDLQGKFQVVSREGKYYVERIKPQYPKTYEECCEVLGIGSYFEPEIRNATAEECHIFMKLIRLKRCRDAYWKIYGEEMGLSGPWEPDWDNLSTNHEFIKINKGCFTYSSRVLVFPTAEMRDAYKENFDNDIEICKDFL